MNSPLDAAGRAGHGAWVDTKHMNEAPEACARAVLESLGIKWDGVTYVWAIRSPWGTTPYNSKARAQEVMAFRPGGRQALVRCPKIDVEWRDIENVDDKSHSVDPTESQ